MNLGGRILLADIGGRLHVELSEPTELIAPGLANTRAPGGAAILSIKLESYMFDGYDLRPLRGEELDAVGFEEPAIEIGSFGKVTRHVAPNGEYFTVRDILAAVEDVERVARVESEWFGGVDVHHVFFEGLHESESGVWRISWGS